MSTGLRNVIWIIAFVVALFWAISVAQDDAEGGQRPVPLIICDVFASRCAEALEVAYCESHWSTTARNGQYYGLFQVSGHWRRTVPGWGWSAEAQSRHAYRVFKRTGSTWAHWSCKPT